MGDNAYKQRHKEQGLCVDCGRKAAFRSIYCLEHLRAMRERRKSPADRAKERLRGRRRKKYYKDNGLCIACGVALSPELDVGHVKCMNCRYELHRERIPNGDPIA